MINLCLLYVTFWNCLIIINKDFMELNINRISTHPGDVLKEEIEARGISQRQFSEMLGVSYTMLNEILNCKRPVTSDFALLVEACLGISPELLINMQSRYNLTKAKMNPSLIARISNIRKAVAAL